MWLGARCLAQQRNLARNVGFDGVRQPFPLPHYRVAVTNPYMGPSVWIAEPFAAAAARITPWAIGVLGSLLTIMISLAAPVRAWRREKWMLSQGPGGTASGGTVSGGTAFPG
jgi:hypothetical protein